MSHVMHHFMSAVECEKNELQGKVKTLHVEEEACRCLQQRIQQLEGQISETQLRLDKESAKYHSACRQQEVSVTTNTELFVVFGWRTSPSHPTPFFCCCCCHASSRCMRSRNLCYRELMLSTRSVKSCRASWGRGRRDRPTCTISWNWRQRKRNRCRLSWLNSRYVWFLLQLHSIFIIETCLVADALMRLSNRTCVCSSKRRSRLYKHT